jgi:hypothetical protein
LSEGADERTASGRQVKVRARSDSGRQVSVRCPFCHEEQGEFLRLEACPSCLVGQHAACWEEHGACAVCGSERAEGVRVRVRAARLRGAVDTPPRSPVEHSLSMVAHLCVYSLLFPPLLLFIVPFLIALYVGATEDRPFLRRHAGAALGALVSYLGVALLGLLLVKVIVGLMIVSVVAVLILLLPIMNMLRARRKDAPYYVLSLGE